MLLFPDKFLRKYTLHFFQDFKAVCLVCILLTCIIHDFIAEFGFCNIFSQLFDSSTNWRGTIFIDNFIAFSFSILQEERERKMWNWIRKLYATYSVVWFRSFNFLLEIIECILLFDRCNYLLMLKRSVSQNIVKKFFAKVFLNIILQTIRLFA